MTLREKIGIRLVLAVAAHLLPQPLSAEIKAIHQQVNLYMKEQA